jgi:GNAT superfamily N-acetyltransferase
MKLIDNNILIKIVSKWEENDIVNLYKAGGWWKDTYNPSEIDKLIKGSYAFVVIINKELDKTIGMGRIISDGISDAYFQDLIILPEYRGKGYGKHLVEFLINHCLSNGIHWIGLISEPGQDGFYSKMNFYTMKDHVPMKYKIED